jgi:hypothetical protein
VIAEVSDGARWRLVEPQFVADQDLDMDLLDVPRDRFLVGADVTISAGRRRRPRPRQSRNPFPLVNHNDHYVLLLEEVADEVTLERRNRSYPRVIKRKMSNFPVKRSHHRQHYQHSRPPYTAVMITPPSKTAHRKRPARTA